MSFFDTERFIVEVEKEDCLWKINSKEYMVDRYVKAKAWTNIASTMYNEWQNFNKEQQEYKIEELKKKWKHLRDNYARDLNETRKIQSGSEARYSKKYIYSDVLSFLQPVIKKRKTTGNIQSPTGSTDIAISIDELGKRDNLNQLDESATESVREECGKSVPKRPKKNEQITSFQKNLLDIMKNPPVHNSEDFDPDKYFLLSFLPNLKKMDENQKLDLKIQFMQSVKNILNPPQTLSFNHHIPNPHHFNYYQNNYHSLNSSNLNNDNNQPQPNIHHFVSPHPSPQLHPYPGFIKVDVNQEENSHHTI